VRAFFAIPMPEAAREALLLAQRQLDGLEGVSWTGADNFHLTLAFLGEIDEEGVQSARSRLSSVVVEHDLIRIDGLSAFPSAHSARVLWAGIAGGQRCLQRLADALRPALESMRAEPFVPHVTIGRVRSGCAPLDAAERIARVSASVRSAAFQSAPVVLYESVRTQQGSRYRELARRE